MSYGKLVGTRIRVEKSEHKTDYFPEYCLEEKNWFGKVKQNWYGVSDLSTHKFGEARRSVNISSGFYMYSEDWAKAIIDTQDYYWEDYLRTEEHQQTKEITYVKYP